MHSFGPSFVAALLAASGAVFAQNTDEFTIQCNPLTIQRSDPVVQPGIPSGHIHNVVGGTAFNRTMSIYQARDSQATTCNKILDKSNYWIPQLYHIMPNGSFELVEMSGIAAYYLNRGCKYDGTSDNCDKDKPFYNIAPPAGLRMFSGDPSLRNYTDTFAQRAISHHCLSDGPPVETKSLPKQKCNRIRSQVTFPACWDGNNTDSDNHKSHMSFYQYGDYNGGRCPQSHPIPIMQVFVEFYYEVKKYTDRNFVYAMGDKTGYGLHADFINGWTNQTALGLAHKTCTGNQGMDSPNCSINVPGNTGPGVSRNPEIPAPYEEEIGLHGPIDKLPGNNAVTGNTPTKRSRVFGSSAMM